VLPAVLECHLNTKSGQFELAGIGKLAEKQFTIDSLDDLRKLSKISFLVVTHAQSCWTVVNSTKSVSAELSDFGL
jgi:hypothetical protein